MKNLNEAFAVKIIRSSDEEYQQVALKEYWTLKKLNHPGIVKVHDAFNHLGKGTIYIVMDLI
jgi:serine/threonine protein kinase